MKLSSGQDRQDRQQRQKTGQTAKTGQTGQTGQTTQTGQTRQTVQTGQTDTKWLRRHFTHHTGITCLFSKLFSQEISEELEVQFDQKEIELLQKLAGEDGLVV